MITTPFGSGVQNLLAEHNIAAPRFAYGTRVFDGKVLYSGPIYGTEEMVAAIVALCEGKWSVNGEYVHRFEREFSKVVKQKESVMVNSGSSADLLMVAAAKKRYDWKDGDGIIVSPVGFPTTVSAITLNGLKPIFVDVEWDTLNFDLDQVERMHFRAKAILVSPVLGNPPDIDRLLTIAKQYGLILLLDGCDSLGTRWREKELTEYFAASTCSFFPAHHISTLQGGIISSNDGELIAIARSMAAWGKDCFCVGAGNLLPNGVCGRRFSCWLPAAPDVMLDHRYTYGEGRAYNLQPLDLQGAFGLEQLKKLEWIHWSRRLVRERVLEAFAPLMSSKLVISKSIYTTKNHVEATVSWFGVPIICNDYEYKTRLVDHLEANGVQTRQVFGGNLLAQEGYRELGDYKLFPGANEVLRRVFFVGCAPFYTDDHINHIAKTVAAFQP